VNILRNLPQPIVALSPMDGVTDVAYRYIHKKYGNPDVMFTEFTHVMGLLRGASQLFLDQLFDEIERPVIGQVFGASPEDFYHAAKIIAALDFDGIDINMGCPMKNVTDTGCGAALILTPKLAQEIVVATKKGVADYLADGKLTGVAESVPQLITQNWEYRQRRSGLTRAELLAAQQQRQQDFTVSIKTRIGYSEVVVQNWIQQLTETAPDWISVHGRTLKQLYTGQADWSAIKLAVEATHIPILGNGDVLNSNDAVRMVKQTGVNGVLIGRGSYGNPWVFKQKQTIKQLADNIVDYKPTKQERLAVMLEHSKLHWETKGEKAFVQMRKNFGWYCKDFDGAAELRVKLMSVKNLAELEAIVSEE
jgi:tRNA-dihydrouridine synthase B